MKAAGGQGRPGRDNGLLARAIVFGGELAVLLTASCVKCFTSRMTKKHLDPEIAGRFDAAANLLNKSRELWTEGYRLTLLLLPEVVRSSSKSSAARSLGITRPTVDKWLAVADQQQGRTATTTTTQVTDISRHLDLTAIYGDFATDFDTDGVQADYLAAFQAAAQDVVSSVTIAANGMVFCDIADTETALHIDWCEIADSIDIDPILDAHERTP